MGATYVSFQLRNCSVATAEQAMGAFLDGLRERRSAAGPPRTGFAVETGAHQWRGVFPDELYGEDDVRLFARTCGLPGVYLECADSDTWSFSVFAHNDVLARLGDEPRSVAKALEGVAGGPLALDQLSAVLQPADGPAEVSLERFARLLGIENSENSYQLIRKGWMTGIGRDEVEIFEAETSPDAGVPGFDVYLYARTREVLAPDRSVPRLVQEVSTLLASEAEWSARVRPAEGAADSAELVYGEGADLEELAARGDDSRLVRLEVDLGDSRLTYDWRAPDHEALMLRAPGLLAPDGSARAAKLGALLVGAEPGLHELAFVRFGAWHGCVMPIAMGDDGGELERLVSWPPFGHWLDYLSSGLVEKCGGSQRVAAALDGYELSSRDSSVTSRLPMPPIHALDPAVEPVRRRLCTLIGGAVGTSSRAEGGQ